MARVIVRKRVRSITCSGLGAQREAAIIVDFGGCRKVLPPSTASILGWIDRSHMSGRTLHLRHRVQKFDHVTILIIITQQKVSRWLRLLLVLFGTVTRKVTH